MKILFTVAGLSADYGGPSHSVPALAAAMARQGARAELVTCDAATGQGGLLLPPENLVNSHILPHRNRTSGWLSGTSDFTTALQDLAREGQDCVIHDNGLWLAPNHVVARAATMLKCPLVISPRGMLSSWAIAHKGWKKRIAWSLYQKRDLQRAAILHATSTAEAQEFRAAGLIGDIAVVPNGVEIPPMVEGAGARTGDRTVLFLSRIHPKKGLLNLVAAWAQTKPAGWKVILVGNDETGHSAELKSAMQAAGVEQHFTFAGPVGSLDRWKLYRDADLFVLPSHSENFGLVVAEAMAAGLPVITTKGTPWEELTTHRCGWWVDIGAAPLAEALRLATGLSDAERTAMGQRGREWMEKQYSWSGVAAQMRSVYGWMLGHGMKPDFINS